MKTPTRSQTNFCKRFLYRYFLPAERSVAFLFLPSTLSLALILSSVYGRIHYSSGRSLTARVAQQCKSPGADAIKNYNDAANSARTSLEKLRTANGPVKSDAETIKTALEKVTADDANPGLVASLKANPHLSMQPNCAQGPGPNWVNFVPNGGFATNVSRIFP